MKTYRPTRLLSTPSIGGGAAAAAPPIIDNTNPIPLYEVVGDARHNTSTADQVWVALVY